MTSRRAETLALNQDAIKLRINGEISPAELDAFRMTNEEEIFRIDGEISALDSEKTTMEEMKQAEADSVDLVSAWEKSNVNQRQELAKSFFPEGLVFSHERGFFEPEMIMRWLTNPDNIGVPDGI